MSTDIQAVPRWASKADIGDLLRHRDLADEIAARRDAVDPVACTRPNVAVNVDAETVRNSRRDVGDHAVSAERAVRRLEGADVVGPVGIRPET